MPVKNWGHINEDDNAALDAAVCAYQQHVKRLKSANGVEAATRSFMQEYLKIGEDPTDTVVRNAVWRMLLRATKRKMSEAQVDAIWNEEVSRSQQVCVIS